METFESAGEIAMVWTGATTEPDPLAALVASARAGDRAAADRLWSSVRPRLLRIGLALGIAPADVPDLVQDALVAAHAALARFDARRGRFETWLGTILVRRARNAQRAAGRRRRLAELFGRSARKSTDARPALEARLTIERLLAVLGPREREVVALYEIGELAAEECAHVLGITAAGVRSIARDARQRLAAALEREERP